MKRKVPTGYKKRKVLKKKTTYAPPSRPKKGSVRTKKY